MANALWQLMVVTHRYLGVAVGVLMAMWFLSGMVMMYVGFAGVEEETRARTLLPISWQTCCAFGEQPIGEDQTILGAQVEDLAGVPVMRLRRVGGAASTLDLAHGVTVRIDVDRAEAIVLDAAPRIIGQPAQVLAADRVETDQWTIGRLARDRPLYRFGFDDPARTNIYVSGTTGQIVHWTTATQRFWNWLGAIPHFLYFTKLRSNVALWTQIVVCASTLGTFLVVLGFYLGVAQFRLRSGDGLSPHHGLLYWHHVIGLVFGLVTLTWVVSGLVSMNPWGFLEGRPVDDEQNRLRGPAPSWSDLRNSLDAVRARTSVAAAVSLVTAPLAGRLYWLATRNDGTVIRLDAAGEVAAPTAADLAQAARRIAGTAAIAEQRLIDEEDAYYFKRRGEKLVLPVYRVVLNDVERTRYYLDPNSGMLLQRAGASERWHRWLFGALHRVDFAAWIRARPLWDIVMLTLMLGGCGVTATGCYLALRRFRRDLVHLFRVACRPRIAANPSTQDSDVMGA